jgi:hypothetical protein
MFRANTSLLIVPSINSWNWSSVTSTYAMFFGATLYNQALTMDTSSFTDISYMFIDTSVDQDFSSWVITSVIAAISFLQNVTLSVANYNALILSWSEQAASGAYAFHGGNSKYTGGGAVATARAAWEGKGWTLTDGGIA